MDQAPAEKSYRHLSETLSSSNQDMVESLTTSTPDGIPRRWEPSENLSERCWVAIDSLVLVDSPRVSGLNHEHAGALAELEATLPPITVQRETMRVIDGMHRLQAAMLRGQDKIEARFFSGSPEDAFVLAVRLNAEHGLPLSRDDRNAAAKRIVRSHPDWSDRLIASIVGLSPKTVGTIRVRSSEEFPQTTRRVGRDGRVRQIGSVRAPTVSDRRTSQVVAQGSTLHTLPRNTLPRNGDRNVRQPVTDVSGDLLFRLRRDPSLRMTELGRHLLRFMDVYSVANEELDRLIECVPPHCVGIVIRLARDSASRWNEFADALVTRKPTETA